MIEEDKDKVRTLCRLISPGIEKPFQVAGGADMAILDARGHLLLASQVTYAITVDDLSPLVKITAYSWDGTHPAWSERPYVLKTKTTEDNNDMRITAPMADNKGPSGADVCISTPKDQMGSGRGFAITATADDLIVEAQVLCLSPALNLPFYLEDAQLQLVSLADGSDPLGRKVPAYVLGFNHPVHFVSNVPPDDPRWPQSAEVQTFRWDREPTDAYGPIRVPGVDDDGPT